MGLKTKLICIDPGTTHSGFALLSMDDRLAPDVLECGVLPNEDIADRLCLYSLEEFAYADSYLLTIEDFQCYGMAVGQSTIRSIRWSGRFIQAGSQIDTVLIARPTIKALLCKSARANDSNVRRAILDRYPKTGGGKTPQIGTKAKPGPLYGVKSHIFSAIALGMAYLDPEFNNGEKR